MKRVWVDANLVLRFLTGESPDLARRARALFARAENGELELGLTPLVVAEVTWVLRSYYKKSMDEVSKALGPLILANGIYAEHPGLT